MATAAAPYPSAAPATTTDGGVGVAWDDDGRIVYAGPADGLPWAATLGHADRGCLVPGFVDQHTHLPFVGWRADEFEATAARGLLPGTARRRRRDLPVGAPVRRGERRGGARVLASAARRDARARHDRARAEDRLRALGRPGAAGGTARAAPRRRGAPDLHRHAARRPRGAGGHRPRRVGPVRVRRADPGSRPPRVSSTPSTSTSRTSPSRSRTWTPSPARPPRPGLALRVHADQLGDSGAAAAAARLGARSADHLNHCSGEGVEALAASRHGRGPAAGVDLLPAREARPGARPARGRRAARTRDRREPRHVAGRLDARGDRDGRRALRGAAARGAHRRDARTRRGCSVSPSVSARSSPASAPTSCCSKSPRSRRCPTARGTTRCSRRSRAASSCTDAPR